MNPDDRKYTAEHEWVLAQGAGAEAVLRIGITGYAQEALGDIVFVTLPAVGDEVSAGASLGEVESTKSVSDVYAPVAGTVSAVNGRLESSPELVNADPYGDGWLVEISPSGGIEQAMQGEALLDAEGYAGLTGTA